MGRLENAVKVGIRDKETNKLLDVYPYKAEGTDAEIDKTVRDWYYRQSCGAEDILRTSYIDALTDNEAKSYSNKEQ